MEARLLASVLQTDTHKRLAAADEISEYLKKDETNLDEFAEMDRFVSALAAWMGSSNFKVSVSAMEIMGVLVEKLGTKFKCQLSTIFPPLKERLGDAKEQVREQGQQLIQQIFQNVVGSPQAFLDKLMDICLVHKNWRVKEQGLLCLSRTLSYFGSGQVTVGKYMGPICTLLGDANSQVRSCAMETIVNIYRHVGVKVRIDVSRRNLQQSHLAKLNAQFDAVDATTGNSKSDNEDLLDDYDRESVSSSGSARTFGSTRSSGRSSTAIRIPSRPSSVARMATTSSGTSSGSGGVTETDFEKVFSEIPDISMFTQHDVEKRVTAINGVLSGKDIHWEKRVAALKELRSVAKSDVIDHAHFITVLRNIETSMELSLKDLRSQITREACITVSYLSTILGSGFAHFAEAVVPQLIVLLPNSAKIMASSAEVCVKFIIKNTPTHRLLTHISNGMSSKSSVTRRQCAEFISLATSAWSRSVLEKGLPLLEELIRKGLKDADAQARKQMRRAFWGYHAHFPSNANRMLDTFDPQLVKYVNDERALLEKEANGIAAATTTQSAASLRPPHSRRKHAPPLASQSETCLLRSERSMSPPSPSKESLAPAIRLVRPTIRKSKGDPSKILRPASSMETLLDRRTDRPKSPSTSPIPRPPSRTGNVMGIRPPSRTGIPRLDKKVSGNELLPGKKAKMRSRSAQPSPSHSRESSPVRDGVRAGMSATLPQKIAPLTTEAVDRLQSFKDGVGNHDDDDVESVTSECSTYSISSEVSVSPYVRYPHPVTDLNELVTLCSSSQWSERRDGIGQLHMLLESSRPFTHSDMVKVKAVFKRMLAEPHAKVFSMFLDTLGKFIEEHGEQLDDWLFIMLLRLIHRQGTDMLSSVHFKLQIVLEHIRKSFEESMQFSVLCRILTDQTQPMNNKVKLGWLEYFLELLPSLDSACFKDSTEIRQALSKLLAMTMEPKSADIRRLSQKVIIGFFDLNPATLTLLLRNMSKNLQESANRILKGYMNDMSSSSGEESDKEATPKKVRRRSGAATPTGGRPGTTTPSGLRTPGQYRPKTPQSSKSRLAPTASLPPSGPRGLRGARNISSSTPTVNNMDAFLNRSATKSRIPTPRSVSGIPRRPGSTTPGASPRTSPATVKRAIPPRAQSVAGMASHSVNSSSASILRSLNSASKIKRPGSSRSEYTPMRYQNGSDEGSVGTPGSTLEQFSFSDLPHLDFGSPDEDEGDRDPTSPGEKDQMATVTRELQTASSTKNRQVVLQSLLTLSREYPEKCNWEEHFKTVLLRLLDLMGDSDETVKLYSLRILREMLKTQHKRLKDYAELTTLKVLKCFTDSDPTVSQASEDVFTLLAPALPPQSAVDLLAPMVATEKHPMLLGTIKLFTKIISLADADYLRSKLGNIVPGIIRGYCHSESSVRKGSVFCLVALHSVVGEDIREHLTKLSSSQTKLLDLYIKRHQQGAASKAKT